MKEMWNNRYGKEEFAYGDKPNEYFRSQLVDLEKGKILLPAEGEGRNAVFAAKSGWEVWAFDQSDVGRDKALWFAEENNVEINYKVGELSQILYSNDQFDAIGLIYVHFPKDLKEKYYRKLTTYLKPGGVIIIEAFSRFNLELNAEVENPAGPRDINMLFTVDELKHIFYDFQILELKEEIVTLNEGIYHQGKNSVIRFVGRKK